MCIKKVCTIFKLLKYVLKTIFKTFRNFYLFSQTINIYWYLSISKNNFILFPFSCRDPLITLVSGQVNFATNLNTCCAE